MYSASSWCVRARLIAGVSPALGGLATLLAVVFMILFFYYYYFGLKSRLSAGCGREEVRGRRGSSRWVGGGFFFFFSRHYSIAVCLL